MEEEFYLHAQAEAMTRHYATPVLLIQFDRDRAFALHATSEIGSDINVRPVSYPTWKSPWATTMQALGASSHGGNAHRSQCRAHCPQCMAERP